MTELDDRTLQAAQRGERPAQEAFLRRYAGPLHALIRRSGAPGEPDDLLHDLLGHLMTALPRFRPDGSATLSTWVFTLAQRFVIDVSRKRHLQLAPLEAGRKVEDSGPRPDEALERAELRSRLEAALLTLPVEQRRVFVLAQVHQRPLAEIAFAESLPVGTVKSRLHRARAALMTALSPDRGESRALAR